MTVHPALSCVENYMEKEQLLLTVLQIHLSAFLCQNHRMKRLLFIFVVVLLGCKPFSEDIPSIDIDNLQKSDHILLSEIADSVFFIPLDGSKPLAHMVRGILGDTMFYFAEGKGGAIRGYSLGGSFLRQYGSVGHGPGEYMHCLSFRVDANGKVYVSTSNNSLREVLIYRNDGRFERKLDFYPSGIGMINDMVCFGDYLFIRESSSRPSPTGYHWLISDTLGNIINRKKSSYSGPLCRDANSFFLTRDYVCWWDTFNDTVFQIGLSGDCEVRYLWRPSDSRLPEAPPFKIVYDENYRIISDPYPDAYRFEDLIELPDGNLLGKFWKGCMGSPLYWYYNPLSQKGKYSSYIVDDLCGRIYEIGAFSINISWTSHGAYIIQELLPVELKHKIASDDFDNIEIKSPHFKRQLQELADSLKEDDNSVIIAYRLKGSSQ